MTSQRKKSAKDIFINTLTELLQKKSFQKISVNELCESSGLSRSAFYTNFEDKYHLLSYCLENITNELDKRISLQSPKNFFVITLDYIQTNSNFFYNAFGAEPDKDVTEVLYDFFNRHLMNFLTMRTVMGKSLPGPIDVVSSFYVGGLLTSTMTWIKSGYKVPKEEIANCHLNLLKDIL